MSLGMSDRLVIFGISGDLAYKMTIPSLYRLEKRGLLEVRCWASPHRLGSGRAGEARPRQHHGERR